MLQPLHDYVLLKREKEEKTTEALGNDAEGEVTEVKNNR